MQQQQQQQMAAAAAAIGAAAAVRLLLLLLMGVWSPLPKRSAMKMLLLGEQDLTAQQIYRRLLTSVTLLTSATATAGGRRA
jgi:hypothetical protein